MNRKRQNLAAAAIGIAVFGAASSNAALAGESVRHAPPAVFATDARANPGKAIPGAAAVVDGHIIPMDEVVSMCLLNGRTYVIDQMVQGYVVDRECKRRGITVRESEIDDRVAALRKQFAPATLEETLAQHQWTIDQLRQEFRRKIAIPLLVADQIRPVPMVHCREILVKCRQEANPSSATRSAADALALVTDIQKQLQQGGDFATLSARYSEAAAPEHPGDLGILYDHMLNVEAPVLTAAMTLHKGNVSPQPIRTTEGYCLLQAVSTGDDHPAAEDALYADAVKASSDLQIMFLGPKLVADLIGKSRRTYASDADLAVGKPLPRTAAMIDGHPIWMKEVLAKCLADSGPSTVDILVQNYVVDRECQRRGITVRAAEIDALVEKLRKQMAPHSLAEGMAIHHTTMDGLRRDFRQQIERTRLVLDTVPPTKMVHAQSILLRDTPKDTATPAKATVLQIRDQLIEGKSFAELAKQYAKSGEAGDIGILYAGKQGIDTAILNTALTMRSGEVTPNPIQTYDGYLLTQVISTSDDHPAAEDAAYAAARNAYCEQEAQKLVPQAIVALLKNAKIVYYIHR